MTKPQPGNHPATVGQPDQPQDRQMFLWPFSDLVRESDQSTDDDDKARVEHVEDTGEPRHFKCQLCEKVLRGAAWRLERCPWYLCNKCFEPDKGIGDFRKVMFTCCGSCRAPPRGTMLLAKCGRMYHYDCYRYEILNSINVRIGDCLCHFGYNQQGSSVTRIEPSPVSHTEASKLFIQACKQQKSQPAALSHVMEQLYKVEGAGTAGC